MSSIRFGMVLLSCTCFMDGGLGSNISLPSQGLQVGRIRNLLNSLFQKRRRQEEAKHMALPPHRQRPCTTCCKAQRPQGQPQEIGRYDRIINLHSWISNVCRIFVNNRPSVSRQKCSFWGEIMWNHRDEAWRHGGPEFTMMELGAYQVSSTFAGN